MPQKHYSREPLISVVITCYNYGKYIKEAIQSVAEQTYKKTEIIVIDDGSTDDTAEVVRQLQASHKNLKYIHQSNQGIVKTRNRGLREAGGEFVLQLDADDVLELNYIEETLKVAQEEKADIVYTNVVRFDAENDTSDFPKFTIEELKNHNFIHVSSLIRAEAAKGFSFDDNLNNMTHEDWDFFLNLCLHGRKAVLCTTTNLRYRIHDSARNNRFNKEEDKRRYTDVYAYVIDKYKKEFPNEFSYLIGRVFADWYAALDNKRRSYAHQINDLSQQRDTALEQAYSAHKDLDKILNSKRYKLASGLAWGMHPVGGAKKLVRTIYKLPARIRGKVADIRDVRKANTLYALNDSQIMNMRRKSSTKLAVVLHLYYIDMWSQFTQYLKRLEGQDYDLFVTIPVHHGGFRDKIIEDFKNAQVFAVPNRGRDVLPFIWLASHLERLGYETYLKLHSKKSKHRSDGSDWFESIINHLVPDNPKVVTKISQKIGRKDTALIGPGGQYVSLRVNYRQNKDGLARVFNDMHAELRPVDAYKYGFFAGTMFWGRIDAISDVLAIRYSPKDFPLEKGQIDATLAHALERVIGSYPETLGKSIYSICDERIIKIQYDSGDIPEWADAHVGV